MLYIKIVPVSISLIAFHFLDTTMVDVCKVFHLNWAELVSLGGGNLLWNSNFRCFKKTHDSVNPICYYFKRLICIYYFPRNIFVRSK